MAGATKKAKRELTEVVAFEVSLVDRPANERSFLQLVKSANGAPMNTEILAAHAALLARRVEGVITKAATEPAATAKSLRELAKELGALADQVDGESSDSDGVAEEADDAGEQDKGSSTENAAASSAGDQQDQAAGGTDSNKALLDQLAALIDAKLDAKLGKSASTPADKPKIPAVRTTKAKPTGSNALGSDGSGSKPGESPWKYDMNDDTSPAVN
jgi:hypothetical protein